MNSKEIQEVVETVSNVKGLPEDKVFEVLEYALAVAAKNSLDKGDINVRVSIDPKTCEYKVYRMWDVVPDDEVTKPLSQITLSAAQLEDPSKQVGDVVEDEIDMEESKARRSGFDRIAAQTAKNVIVQKIRDAEKERVVSSYKNLVGKLVVGTVKKKNRDSVILDLGSRQGGNSAEAVMTRENWLRNDTFTLNQQVRAVLLPIPENKSGLLNVSRTTKEFLIEIIKSEVPEIADGFVDIRSVARDPGNRSKIAVVSKDKRIDPVGACVGMRQSRINAILDELDGEKLDIVVWDPDPVNYVINAMSPARVEKVSVNEENHSMDLAVTAENKPQAIGKSGVNVRLASRLTGWSINVFDVDEYDSKMSARNSELIALFCDVLNIDEEFAEVLVDEGFESLDTIAYVDQSELTSIDGLDEEIAEVMQQRARDAIRKNAEKAKELMDLEGVDTSLAAAFAAMNICTKEDLADMSVDELLDMEGMTQERASRLIMDARKACHWFD